MTRYGWYVPVVDNHTLKGSDAAFVKYYKRADCVREEIERCMKSSKAQELWYITEKQFWDLNWYDIDVLRQHGRRVR